MAEETSFKAQYSDTPDMLDEYLKLCGDALKYHRDRKVRVEEAKDSGIEGGLLDRELEAIDNKISWYLIRIEEVTEFMDSYIFNQSKFNQNKYSWIANK